MSLRLCYFICFAAVLLLVHVGGCPPASPTGQSPAPPTDSTGAEPTGSDTGTPGTDDSNGTTDDQGPATGPLTLSGRINPGQAAKRYPRMQESDATYPFTLVAQSNQTGQVYLGETNEQGDFTIDVPESEAGNTLVVTVLAPDGHALGPVIVEETKQEGVTGVAMDKAADLGTIELPDDPAQQAITAGEDGNAAELAAPEAYARLNDTGAPIGVESVGKGAAAEIDPDAVSGEADPDHDGLINAFDADSNGSGVVDDLKGEQQLGLCPADCYGNFFMNLYVQVDDAQTFYTGTPEQIAEVLKAETWITFEVGTFKTSERDISAVRLLETPGPAYLPICDYWRTQMSDERLNWKTDNYAFAPLPDMDLIKTRFGVWVRPNEVMQAGDVFSAEITFTNGDVARFQRMINYVFKSIPRVVQYGAPGDLHDFDVADPVANGSYDKPIPFDGSQDLVFVFNPPKDETSAYMEGLSYTFPVGIEKAGPAQVQVDYEATWPTPVPHLNPPYWYELTPDAVGTLSAEGTYTITIPKEVLPATVVEVGGGTVTPTLYHVEIAAGCPSGGASIRLSLVRE